MHRLLIAIAIAICACAKAREASHGGVDYDAVRQAFATLRAPMTTPCDVADVQRAFRARALDVHPDKFASAARRLRRLERGEGEGDGKFIDVVEAYATAREACASGRMFPPARARLGVMHRCGTFAREWLYACRRSWDHAREFVYRKFAETMRRQTPRQSVRRVVEDVSPDDGDDVSVVNRRTFWTHVMDTLDVPYDDDIDDDDGIDDDIDIDIDASTFITDEAYPFASRPRAVR